jgi:hypothetical protein
LVHKGTNKEERKRILLNLGERTLESEEDPPEYITGHTSSDEEVRGFAKDCMQVKKMDALYCYMVT